MFSTDFAKFLCDRCYYGTTDYPGGITEKEYFKYRRKHDDINKREQILLTK